jgi:hypothetical protein
VKKRATPIGDTAMGRKGKKYLAFVNGLRSATPRPPSVAMSSSPWDAMARNRYSQARPREKPDAARGTRVTSAPAKSAANTSE